MIRVRRSNMSDVEYMKTRLRKDDVKEIWASHHSTPEDALKRCITDSILSFTVQNGKPIAIFGICAEQVLGRRATIFMLATDDLNKITITFLRRNRKFILYLLSFYDVLENFVHADNKKSILWLKYLGATIEEAKPYGAEGELFHYFYFKRGA